MVKGYLYTLEAVIAGLIILSSTVYLFSSSQQQPRLDVAILREQLRSCVVDLDNRGVLRPLVLTNNSDALRTALSGCVPITASFNSTLCAGDAADCMSVLLPNRTQIVSANYLVAGDSTTFQPTLLKVLAWSIV